MDFKSMRYFLAVAQERNFGRAAKHLHMTQPPLSRHIHALEEELGTQLFVRTATGSELTMAGQILLDEVPNILSLVGRAENKTRLAGKGFVGRLDVGVFSSGILNIIPPILAAFHAQRPDVKIGLYNMTKSEQLEALRERRITVGFNRLVPKDDEIAIEVIRRERLRVALYDGHALCSKRFITLRDLEDEPIILYPNTPLPGLAQEVVSAFRAEGVRLRVEQEVEDFVTSIALVSSGFGLAITTESATNMRLPRVTYRPLKSSHLPDIELVCLYRRDDKSPILHAFLLLARRVSISS